MEFLHFVAKYNLSLFFSERKWADFFLDRKIKSKVSPLLKNNKTKITSISESNTGKSDVNKGDVLSIQAKVTGTKVYNTHIHIYIGGGSVNIIPACSCPVGEHCKHAYAVLETLSRQLDSQEYLLDSQHELSAWIKTIDSYAQNANQRDLHQASNTKLRQYAPLGFLITSDPYYNGEWNLSYLRVIPHEKVGLYTVQKADLSKISKNVKYLRPGDLELISFIEMNCIKSYVNDKFHLPEDEILSIFLDKLVDTGRLFIENTDSKVVEDQLITAVQWKPELVTELTWLDAENSTRMPVLSPNYRLTDFWIKNPLILLDEKNHTLQRVTLKDGIPLPLALHWCAGPMVQEGNIELLKNSKIVTTVAPVESSLKTEEIRIQPKFSVEIIKEKNSAQSSKLRLHLSAIYEGVPVDCSKRKNTLKTKIKLGIVDEGKEKVIRFAIRDGKAERQALRQMEKEMGLIPYGKVERWAGESFYEFHQREYAASKAEECDFTPVPD